jgi:hypothetical protein
VIDTQAKRLTRLPRHLCLAFTERDEISIPHVADLVAWSVSTGIKFISVWDADGILDGRTDCFSDFALTLNPTTPLEGYLKSHQDKLADQVNSRMTALFVKEANAHQVVYLNPTNVPAGLPCPMASTKFTND